MNCILVTNKDCQLISYEDKREIFSIADKYIGLNHLDFYFDKFNFLRIIMDDGSVKEDAYINPLSKYFKTTIKGACLLIGVDSTYDGRNCYDTAIEITEEDFNSIKDLLFNPSANHEKLIENLGYINPTNKHIDEVFFSMMEEQYECQADILSKQAVVTSNLDTEDIYVGFMGRDNRIFKYDKTNKSMVIYTAVSPEKSYTITYYKVPTDRSYLARKEIEYVRDITIDDDKYNI